MKRRLALGAAAITASIMLTTSGAWATESAEPVPAGVTAIADQLLKADSTLRGPGLRNHYNLWVVGIHGQATVRDKKSVFINYTWQRGVIAAKADGRLTIKSKDGVLWNWNLDPTTRIRRLGARADLSKLVVGDGVFVIGVPTAGDPTAAAVFVPRNRAILDQPAPPPAPGS
ncbi:hypothetical protein [Planomonospora venezuelensis]|uniref:Uncharacterized protein n=1 Tax=Planomonospora venezuelensis TaxID=1999 RepID=A0A841D236_PLAVE|nr:hypothetical protein [Planomonospora venezuelensis]MBB5963830.1 hypothetical protein [Planomonospora venezuelensis]GIM99617.1 hypothetical protein Pve01_12760 [Planomonospora venezuelensis]